jgi:hypothetical protein
MPETPEQFERRLKRWRHNGFFGAVAMAQANMRAIINASTTTLRTKEVAVTIEEMLIDLQEQLKIRVDK